jgi:CHC2 zinc finger
MVDFQDLKARVSIEQIVQMLGLTMKKNGQQLRGPCTACRSGGDRALAVNTGNKYFCFSEKKGGDQISLAAHILGVDVKQAAERIADHFKVETQHRSSTNSTPQAPRQKTEGCPELDYLDPIDDAVEAVGLPPAVADLIGAGFASKGTQRGRVLVPLRTKEGDLLGYMGIGLDKEPVYFFPDNLSDRADNIMTFRKKGA